MTVRYVYKQAQAVEDNTYSYLMAAKELEAAEADAQLKKKPRPNNPEAAEEFITQVKIEATSSLTSSTLTTHTRLKMLTPTLSPHIIIS